MRKIIQLLQPTDKSSFTALCNDGSVWYYNSALPGWESLPAIPQDEAIATHDLSSQTGSTYLEPDAAFVKCNSCGAVITDDNPRVHWDDKCKGCCDS
jgi:hypothetical protein